jgi:hypothetical protein
MNCLTRKNTAASRHNPGVILGGKRWLIRAVLRNVGIVWPDTLRGPYKKILLQDTGNVWKNPGPKQEVHVIAEGYG